jgi:hypothetical protein
MIIPLLAVADESNWKWEVNEHNVDVYLSSIPGTDAQAFKAITKMNAQKQVIFSKLIDVSSYTKWMADCVSATVIKAINENEYIARFVNDSPWPVQDRDVVFHRYHEVTPSGGLLLKFKVESHHVAENESYVRITTGHGYFLVEDTDQENVSLVTYEMYVEPGGDLPAWMVNAVVTDSPIETLSKLSWLVVKR